MSANPRCPRCDADAVYSYGRTKNGKQRYLCLLCNRQFIIERSRMEFMSRPECPLCAGKMHVYRKEKDIIRFRCAAYPACKGYEKRSA